MTAALAKVAPEERWAVRQEARDRYLPKAVERTHAKLLRLRAEADAVGLSLPWLESAHTNGDLIATEYLKRLGYFR